MIVEFYFSREAIVRKQIDNKAEFQTAHKNDFFFF